MSLESDGGIIYWQRKTEELGEKPVPVSLSTTNPTWNDPGANPRLRGERPATNDLSHETASDIFSRKYVDSTVAVDGTNHMGPLVTL
jgi:hypothetical protein